MRKSDGLDQMRDDIRAPRITGGPARSASARLAHTLAREILDSGCVPDANQAEDLALRLAKRLAEPDITEHLVERLNMAYFEAISAWNLRDDLFEYPGYPETASRIAVEVFHRAIAQTNIDEPIPLATDPDRVRAILRAINYKGWKFEAVFGEGLPPKVKARAEVENLHRPGEKFQLARSAPIWFGDVVGAAFDAVMVVEEHEAMERFQFAGKQVIDPHQPRSRPVATFQEKTQT